MLPLTDFPFPPVLSPTVPGSKSSNEDRMSTVPTERFALVSRLWPGRWSSPDCGFTHDLRKGLVMPREGSVGGDGVPGFLLSPTNGAQNIDWGLGDDQQQELMQEYACNSPRQHWQCHISLSPACNLSLLSDFNFSSIYLLNLSLLTIFRHTHCLIYFIHQPIFVVQTALKLIIFSLCLQGFVLLNTDKTKDYVDRLNQHPAPQALKLAPFWQ